MINQTEEEKQKEQPDAPKWIGPSAELEIDPEQYRRKPGDRKKRKETEKCS